MTYAIVLLVSSVFIVFFSLVNLRYFGLLPLFFLIFFYSQGFYDFKVNVSDNFIREKYGLYLLSFLVMLGIFGILTFLGASNALAFWILFFLASCAWAASYIFDYQDGKFLFKYGLIVLAGLLFRDHMIHYGSEGLVAQSIRIILALLATFSLIYHGIGPYFSVEKDLYYSQLLLMFLLSVGLIFALQETTMYGFTFGLINVSIALGLLIYAINYIFPAPPAKRELSLRRILAGEKILQKEKPDPFLRRKTFIQDLKESPKFLHRGLEYSNLFLLLGVLVSYILPLFGGTPFHQLWYWTGIALFTINAFLLKKTQAFSMATRFAFALVLNFSLYISLLLLGGDTQGALPRLICWNMLCGILVLYTKNVPFTKYLYKSDLIFWVISSLMAMLLNIYLIAQLPYAGQLAFSLIFLYLGLQGTITYYAFQVIKSYKHKEEVSTADLEKLLNELK